MRRIYIFDTTLRDGEQTPRVTLEPQEKLRIARQLEEMGVDVIEAGFPIASPGDVEAVTIISKEIKNSTVCGLARSVKKDIDVAWSALQYARKPRIHVFIATSEIHMKYKLKKTKEEVLEQAVESVRYARSFCDDVEFSAEDATRSDPEFLKEVFLGVIDAGATVINVPDTVGYCIPNEFGNFIAQIKSYLPEDIILSIHCHNDLGLATANSLLGVLNGANQVEVSVNGLGERAGNAALEEVVMAIRTRKDIFNAYTSINTEYIINLSRLVSGFTGIPVQPNKAIVGINAFAHEAGIHQDGVLKERSTYEIMNPKDIGLDSSEIVLGKHSGRHALNERLKQLGYSLSEEELMKVFERFKVLADEKREILDRDLITLLEEKKLEIPVYRLINMEITTRSDNSSYAVVNLERGEKTFHGEAEGDGPVEALFNAIEKAVEMHFELIDFSLKSVTTGKDALGESLVKLKKNGEIFTGRGTSKNVLEASAIAYINAINRALV
ncbi:MAG TPA: 2-isopropylmalate synthase [bacterium]|nr:2-isopropylmalate synthase [bacterium]